MGIGKLGKKLDKVERKAKKTLGARGKELAQAVLERAISILEAEMKAGEVTKRQGAAERAKRKRTSSSPARVPAPRKSSPSRRKPSRKATSRQSAYESGTPAATQGEPASLPDAAQPSPASAANLGETST
jgi:hypothetical protein